MPPPPPPMVDFSKQMVVGYSWGLKPTLGYEVFITDFEARADGGNMVSVLRLAPGPACGVFDLSMPAGQLLVVDRDEAPVWFTFRDADVRC